MDEARTSIGGRLGFIIVTASASIGLGNLWRFPYLLNEYGGGTFLLIYIIATFTFGLILFLTEVAIGRKTGKTIVEAFGDLCKKYKWLSIFCTVVPFIVFGYIVLIGGWIMRYLCGYITGDISIFQNFIESESFYFDFISCSSGGILNNPFMWMILFTVISAAIIFFSAKNGMEKIGKICLPIMFIIMVGLVIFIMTIPGIGDGFAKMFVPDFDNFNADVILGAIGQVFFSMSLATGSMVMFGSYMPKNSKIIKNVSLTTVLECIAAIVCGMVIVPVVFAFGPGFNLDGTGLLFEVLPLVFSNMDASQFIGITFFFMAFIAAWTSGICLVETIVSILKDTFNIDKRIGALLSMVLGLTVGTLCCLSYSVWNFTVGGMHLLEILDYLVNNLFMPLGAIATCIFVGYIIKPNSIMDELESNGEYINHSFYNIMIKYVCPILLAVLMITGILSKL